MSDNRVSVVVCDKCLKEEKNLVGVHANNLLALYY